jgi:hypothetical protein
MKIKNSVTELIGSTPLLRLNKMEKPIEPKNPVMI